MTRAIFDFRAGEKTLQLGKSTRIMGIVNMTPDSFSDGGRYNIVESAMERCLAMLEAGVDIIDIGGESSRPGANRVAPGEELDRIMPLVEMLRPETDALLSIDTCKAEVAETALRAGADIINDISALRHSPGMAETVSRFQAGLIVMHMRGNPSNMHLLEPSPDIMSEVIEELQISLDKAVRLKVSRDRIIVDPGIGFGKNHQENLLLLNRLPQLAELGFPLLVGTSRKRFIGAVLDRPVTERLSGTIASSVVAILNGAHILRVHDVAEMKEAAEVVDSITLEKLTRC